MIVSASYKTDIPTFYGEWFRNRLDAGFCRVVNPYNKNQHNLVSLQREDVDGFIFWTKNLTPFVDTLDEVHQRGYPFVVQYTINGYPRTLETRVVNADRSVRSFRLASKKYGEQAMVWRYDTIIFTTETDAEFHRNNFAALASELAGYTSEVVVSFMQIYKKTRWNLDEAARENGFSWHDPSIGVKRGLLSDLVKIADRHSLSLSICAQPDLLVPGANEASCVDAKRLMSVAGRTFRSRVKGTRLTCNCYESKDIGDYDTCPHGCIYCYAVRERSLAIRRYQNHDPLGEYLFPQRDLRTSDMELSETEAQQQMPLFTPGLE